MITYTFLSVLSVPLVVVIDYLLGTRLYMKPIFWKFHAVVFILTALVDNYSGSRPVIIYNDAAYLGLRLLHVPLENFLFGFSLITFNLILYERFSAKK